VSAALKPAASVAEVTEDSAFANTCSTANFAALTAALFCPETIAFLCFAMAVRCF
jgi:hypothetical protein